MTLKGDTLETSVNNILVYLIGLGVVALVGLSWSTSIGIAEIKGSLDTFKSADTVAGQRLDKVENHLSLNDKDIAELKRQADRSDARKPK